MKFLSVTLAGLFAELLISGCGQSNTIPTAGRVAEMNLEQVGQLLREYQLNKGVAPKSAKELIANPGGSLGGAELVGSGDVIVLFGATLPDTKEEPGQSPNQEVLAYGKDVPEKGGPVLLVNRTIRQMTAEEFKAVPKVDVRPAAR